MAKEPMPKRFPLNRPDLAPGGGDIGQEGPSLMSAFSTALAFFDGFRNERLPTNPLRAQRVRFGAHTYERVDKPRGEFFHTNWTGHGGRVASGTYTV
jgi:hypothetical protein